MQNLSAVKSEILIELLKFASNLNSLDKEFDKIESI